MALIGYGRCSTKEQNTDDQRRRLEEAGCAPSDVFLDEGVSGKLASRPEWDRAMAYMRPGDTLVVTKLDRAGRSVRHLLELSERLHAEGKAMRILDQGIDTNTAIGRMFYTILGALAEFERELIIERTHEGLRTARLAGKRPGPIPKLSPKQRDMVRQMHSAGRTVVDLAEAFEVSRPVIYRALEATTPAT